MVTRLFQLFATGNYSGWELAGIARHEGLVFRKSGAPIPRATIYKIFRSRIYTGDFDWNGRTYRGIHVPLVPKELWERVQEILDRRFAKRHRKVKHDFAFSGLIDCGHCGCSLVGELKKGRYVYYCSKAKGKCPEPYTREEIFEEKFAQLLRGLTFDDEVMQWVTSALRESQRDEAAYHQLALARLRAEYDRLQARLEAMYVDKLDGRVDSTFFERKAPEWRTDQDGIRWAMEDHQTAGRTYVGPGGPSTGPRPPGAHVVRAAGAPKKATSPELRGFELHVERRLSARDLPPTL